MKKSIGLTANTSEFRPNLPQTKHLNYFMGTNPVYMAGGGDVKAGIPNYPDVNVTRGFLPAALGFDDGGDVGFLEQLKNLLKQFDGDLTKFMAFLQNILGYSEEEAQDLAGKITGQDAQPPSGAVDVMPQPVAPKDTLTPKDTVDVQPPSGAVDVTGKPTRVPDAQPPYGAVDVTPDPTSPRMPDNIPVQSLPGPVGSGIIPPDTKYQPDTGISSITPDAQPPSGAVDVTGKPSNPLDLNGDGVVDWKDLALAAKQGAWDIWEKIQKYIKGFTEGDQEEQPKEEQPPKIEGGPVDMFPSPVEPKPDEAIIPKIKPKPPEPIISKGGITSIEELPTSHPEHPSKKIGKDEQTLFKMLARKNIEETGGTQGKGLQKDIPEWALPMMSAGFAMMASKSPYFMQALGEAGEKGIETYAGIKEAKTAKEKSDAEIELAKAQSKYYLGEGKTSMKPTIITDRQGRRIYATFNNKTKQYEPILTASGEPQYAVRSREDIDKSLALIHMDWLTMSEEDREKLRQAEINKDLGIALTNVASSGIDEDKGPGIFEKGGKYIKGFFSKDGGIVSLRR